MFLQSSSPALARRLCGASCQTLLRSSLHSRSLHKGPHYQEVSRAITLQARQNLWSRLKRDFLGISSQCQAVSYRVNTATASYSTARTTSESRVTRSQEDPADSDKVDLEALVELEIELYRQEGFPIPSELTPRQWVELLELPTVNSRKRFLKFLFTNEKKKENARKIKEINREKREEKFKEMMENPPQKSDHIEYGLWRNSIFLKILDTSMNQFYHSRVVQAMMFGQPLVVDLSYEDYMTRKERQYCAYQLQMIFSSNRKHQEPFSIELHNAPPTLDTMERLERYVPTIYKPEFPLLVHHGSYLEKYPREQLIYLTPHCKEELLTYDHNAVYIIGGIVDKSSGEPLSLAKAKKEGIRMQKLPLERYLSWGIGNKCLTLNQITDILLDFRFTGDWTYSLRHVPRRKLQPPPRSQEAVEESLLKRIERMDRGRKRY